MASSPILAPRGHATLLLALTLALPACGNPTDAPAHAAAATPAPVIGAKPAPTGAKRSTSTQPTSVKKRCALQPLGKVKKKTVTTAQTAIEEVYGWEVTVLDKTDHPRKAWYARRKRWRAEKILDWLRRRVPDGVDRVVALTEDDISTTKGDIYDWGICGLGDIDGPTAVVSTYRIKKGLGKKSRRKRLERYYQRLRDLAAHEFGHTLGLPHCPNKGCIMEDAKGTVRTFDHSTGKLCDECQRNLAEWGYPLPDY